MPASNCRPLWKQGLNYVCLGEKGFSQYLRVRLYTFKMKRHEKMTHELLVEVSKPRRECHMKKTEVRMM